MKSRTLIVAGSVAAFTLIGGSAAIAATSTLGDSRDSGVSQVVPARATTNHPESYEHSTAARGQDDSRREHAVPKNQPSRSAGSRDDSGRDDSGRDDSGRDDSGRDDSGSDDSRTGSSYDDAREHATPSTAATHHDDSRPGDSRDDSGRDDSRSHDSGSDDSRAHSSDDSHEHSAPSGKASTPGHEDRD